MSDANLSIERRWWHALAKLLFAGGLMFCVCIIFSYDLFSIVNITKQLFNKRPLIAGAGQFILGTGYVLIPAIALCFLYFRHAAYPLIRFFFGYIFWASFIYAFYCYEVRPEYVSDFNRMWLAAQHLADSLHPAKNIIEQRALFVLYPIVKIFGAHPAALDAANIVILLLITMTGYDLLRQISGHRPAQAFALVMLGAFEPVMALAIPTHDLWAVLFLFVASWATIRAIRSVFSGSPQKVSLVWIAIAALFFALLQAQREVGIVLLLAACLVWLYSSLYVKISHILRAKTIVALVIFYLMASATLGYSGALAPSKGQEQLNTARIAGFAPAFSNARFAYGIASKKVFLNPLEDDAARGDLARSLFLSDAVSQPSARFPSMVGRMRFVAQPGTQTWYYMAGISPTKVSYARSGLFFSIWFVFGLNTVALLMVLARRNRSLLSLPSAIMVIFAGGMLLAFVTVSEVQPRYAFFMWFVAAIVSADILFRKCSANYSIDENEIGENKHVGYVPLVFSHRLPVFVIGAMQLLVLFAIVVIAWLLLKIVYQPNDGRIITNWRYSFIMKDGDVKDASQVLAAMRSRKTDAFIDIKLPVTMTPAFNKLELPMNFPYGEGQLSTDASSVLCASGNYDLTFFVAANMNNATRETHLEILWRGNEIWSSEPGDIDQVVNVRTPLGSLEGCSPLHFVLSGGGAKVDALGTSEVGIVPEVEIIFPRLVPTPISH